MSSDYQLCGFDVLPDNVLIDIFLHLHLKERLKLSRVCKRWKRVIGDKHLWRKVRFSPFPVKKVVLTKLARQYFTELTKELEFCGTWRRSSPKSGYVVSDNLFTIITKNCKKLKKLEIEDDNFSESKLKLLPNTLKSIKFVSCEIPIISLENVQNHFTKLESLIFRGCSSITDRHLAAFGKLTSLIKLECYGCYRLDHIAVSVICKNFPNLKTLVLVGCPYCNDHSCSEITDSLTNLQVLEIEEWVDLTMAGVKILRLAENLKFLCVKCTQLNKGNILIEGSRVF